MRELIQRIQQIFCLHKDVGIDTNKIGKKYVVQCKKCARIKDTNKEPKEWGFHD